MSTPKRNIS
jgi:hypothetical protein